MANKFMSDAFLSYALPITAFSDAQQAKLYTLLYNFLPVDLQPNKEGVLDPNNIPAIIRYVTEKITEPLTGDSVVYFTLGELFDAEETVVQRDILPGKVYSVLADPDYGYLSGNALIKPPTIGVVRDENGDIEHLVVEAGRHRITGIVTILAHYGLSEDDILDIEIPCISLDAVTKRIIADNKSRGATKSEELGVKLSSVGIDVRSPLAVWQAYLNGDIPGTAIRQRADSFSLCFILTTPEAGELLSDETRRAVAASILSSLKDHFKKEYKDMLADNHFLTRLLEFAKHELLSSVEFCKEKLGVTNYARGYKSIAGVIVQRLKTTLKTGQLSDGTEFDIKVPKPVEKVTAVKATATTASRPKKEKAAPKEGDTPKTKKAVSKKKVADDDQNGAGEVDSDTLVEV